MGQTWGEALRTTDLLRIAVRTEERSNYRKEDQGYDRYKGTHREFILFQAPPGIFPIGGRLIHLINLLFFLLSRGKKIFRIKRRRGCDRQRLENSLSCHEYSPVCSTVQIGKINGSHMSQAIRLTHKPAAMPSV